ncbi:MAG: hypothetical protein OEM02_09590 [Desulfobulbaceae bacterium]|nr:hypothetical protein [Desulfobulbaceae bacterium]
MDNSANTITHSQNLKNAIRYISETVLKNSELSRKEILVKAELRFDLTPRECEFLNANFQNMVKEGL